jgi:hypothetical protein
VFARAAECSPSSQTTSEAAACWGFRQVQYGEQDLESWKQLLCVCVCGMDLRVNTENGSTTGDHEVPQQPNNPYRNKQGEDTINGRVNDGTPGKPRRETVIVRIEQPVEGVESTALTLLRGSDGDVLSPSARNIVFTWKRSAEALACIATGCGNPNKIATIQLLATGQRYDGWPTCMHACMRVFVFVFHSVSNLSPIRKHMCFPPSLLGSIVQALSSHA